jgi:Spy/CpxP family protein refolding chaperone
MNKKIITSLGLALLLTSSLAVAQMNSDKGMCNCAMMQKSGMGQNHKNPIMAQMMSLNLSDEQREKIKAIMMKNMQNMPKISTAFSDKGFDKELFMKLSKEREEKKISQRAEMISSVYEILTPEQKAEFKKMLDHEMMMGMESPMMDNKSNLK